MYRYRCFINAIFVRSNTIGHVADQNYLPAEQMGRQMKAIGERTKRKLRSLKSPARREEEKRNIWGIPHVEPLVLSNVRIETWPPTFFGSHQRKQGSNLATPPDTTSTSSTDTSLGFNSPYLRHNFLMPPPFLSAMQSERARRYSNKTCGKWKR